MTTHFLLNLKIIDDWCELTQDLICLLVVLKLGGNEVGKIAEWLRCVEHLKLLA